MEEAPIVHAVERIEAALARIEAASRKSGELHRRHAKLKASVTRSLADLDALLGPPA